MVVLHRFYCKIQVPQIECQLRQFICNQLQATEYCSSTNIFCLLYISFANDLDVDQAPNVQSLVCVDAFGVQVNWEVNNISVIIHVGTFSCLTGLKRIKKSCLRNRFVLAVICCLI